jgi:hypothetical protein
MAARVTPHDEAVFNKETIFSSFVRNSPMPLTDMSSVAAYSSKPADLNSFTRDDRRTAMHAGHHARAFANSAATQVNFVRHDPSSLSLSGRMSVGVRSDPTELRNPNSGLAVGSHRRRQTAAWPWGRTK